MPDSAFEFYQHLAQDYHLIFSDWHTSIKRHGAALDRLLRAYDVEPPRDVLDCSAGIGTQAIGLATHGYTVHATDISPAAIERATREAASLGVMITTGVADMRNLANQVEGDFDLVISCDNAVPHLLTDADLMLATENMRAKLRDSGLLLISIRDYDHVLLDPPRATLPYVIDEPSKGESAGDTKQRVIFQVWDWQDTQETTQYKLTLFIVQQQESSDASPTWYTTTYRTSYRALRRSELDAALKRTGFTDVRWHMPQDTGYFQPIVVARI